MAEVLPRRRRQLAWLEGRRPATPGLVSFFFFLLLFCFYFSIQYNEKWRIEQEILEKEKEEEEDWDSETPTEEEKFEAWKRRAEAITELREAQDDLRNEESRSWEDWLPHQASPDQNHNHHDNDWEGHHDRFSLNINTVNDNIDDDGSLPLPLPLPFDSSGSLVRSLRSFLLGTHHDDNDNDDDLLYEDRVFRYASTNSVSFPNSHTFFFLFF